MPFEIKQYDNTIIVVTYDGDLNIADHNQEFHDKILPICKRVAPESVHVLHDMRQLDISFPSLLKMLGSMQTRRQNNQLPDNLQQYLIGQNQWVASLYDWSLHSGGFPLHLFTDMDTAIAFIQEPAK